LLFIHNIRNDVLQPAIHSCDCFHLILCLKLQMYSNIAILLVSKDKVLFVKCNIFQTKDF